MWMDAHTRADKWRRITTLAIAVFLVSLIGGQIFGVMDADWALVIADLFFWVTLAAMIMWLVAAPKVFGGLKAGVVALVAGVAFFVVGAVMLSMVETSRFMSVDIPDSSSPLYLIAMPLRFSGIALLVAGAVMAVVSYLRRVLKAVESTPTGAR